MRLHGFIRLSPVTSFLLAPFIAHAQVGPGAGGAGAAGGPGYHATEPFVAGQPIAEVEVEVEPPDPELAAEIKALLPVKAGVAWSPGLTQLIQARLGALPRVDSVRLSSREMGQAGQVLVVRVRQAPTKTTEAPRGLIQSGRLADFPALFRGRRSYLKLVLSGGFGVYSDSNPWFGRPDVFTRNNPLVQDPSIGADTGDFANWGESFVQFGVGGVLPLSRHGLYGFGAVTGITIGSVGRDIFRSDTRGSINLEQLYGGLLWAPDDSPFSWKVSVGRQNFSLNDGFLVSQFGSQWNAGPRPGVYMSPRTAHDFSVLSTIRYKDWSGQIFFLNPNEFEPLESNTQLLGFNARGVFSRRISANATAIVIPRSDTRYRLPQDVERGREGLLTFALRARIRAPEAKPGPWLEGAVAHQQHAEFSMLAWAGFAELGFIARSWWATPSVSYRFAHFTGDEPDSLRYERFDTLYTGGIDHWLQGITINKLLTQANRTTHRLRFNIDPVRTLHLTLDLYLHRAPESNNLGGNPALGTLSSRHLGQEAQLIARWAPTKEIFVQGIASVAGLGPAAREATGGSSEPWTTLQLQLFWGF